MQYEHNRDRAEYFNFGKNTCPVHFHRSIELFYCVKGEKEVYIDGKYFRFGEGEFLMLPPFAVHQFPEDNQISLCVVMPLQYSDIFEEEVGDRKLAEFIIKDAALSRELYLQLSNLSKETSPLARDGIYRYVLGKLLEIAVFEDDDEKKKHSFAFLVLDYLEKNYSSRITLEDAATALGYNRCYFSSLFKKTFRLGFCDYLSMMRVEKSLPLIKKQSIKEAAFAVGFGSLQNYYSAFRRIKGVSPAAYQKKKYII